MNTLFKHMLHKIHLKGKLKYVFPLLYKQRAPTRMGGVRGRCTFVCVEEPRKIHGMGRIISEERR